MNSGLFSMNRRCRDGGQAIFELIVLKFHTARQVTDQVSDRALISPPRLLRDQGTNLAESQSMEGKNKTGARGVDAGNLTTASPVLR